MEIPCSRPDPRAFGVSAGNFPGPPSRKFGVRVGYPPGGFCGELPGGRLPSRFTGSLHEHSPRNLWGIPRGIGSARGEIVGFGPPPPLEARRWRHFPYRPQLPGRFRGPRKLPGEPPVGIAGKAASALRENLALGRGIPPGGPPSHPPGLIPGDLG